MMIAAKRFYALLFLTSGSDNFEERQLWRQNTRLYAEQMAGLNDKLGRYDPDSMGKSETRQ